MNLIDLHAWNLSPSEAVALQRRLAERLISAPAPQRLNLVAGADAAYDLKANLVIAGVIVWDLVRGRVEDQSLAWSRINFPYVSGLLTFREGPALIKALAELKIEPDVVLFDGQGQAHPRRLGLAAHLGLWLERPTIGCAKSLLFGRFGPLGPERGLGAEIRHPTTGQVIGRALRTRRGVKPVFVSPGQRAELDWSCDLILSLALKFRLPEPLRAAHHLVTRARRDHSV